MIAAAAGESIPIRLFLAGYEMTPTMKDINKKFTVRYYLNLVLIDEEDRRYFKQQVCCFQSLCCSSRYLHIFTRGLQLIILIIQYSIDYSGK